MKTPGCTAPVMKTLGCTETGGEREFLIEGDSNQKDEKRGVYAIPSFPSILNNVPIYDNVSTQPGTDPTMLKTDISSTRGKTF
jgi:hypothetical protein